MLCCAVPGILLGRTYVLYLVLLAALLLLCYLWGYFFLCVAQPQQSYSGGNGSTPSPCTVVERLLLDIATSIHARRGSEVLRFCFLGVDGSYNLADLYFAYNDGNSRGTRCVYHRPPPLAAALASINML